MDTQHAHQPPPPQDPAEAPATPAQASQGEGELLDLLQRERAEFRNYKHRIERQRAFDRERASLDLLGRLLPLLDDLDRALGQVPPELQAHPWAKGTALSRNQLMHALDQIGLERFGNENEPFDPARHDAVFHDRRSDAADTRVGTVIRPGYQVGDQILRPAQVTVVGPDYSDAEARPDLDTEQDPAAAQQRPSQNTKEG